MKVLSTLSLLSAVLLLVDFIQALPVKAQLKLLHNPCLLCNHIVRHTNLFGVDKTEKLCKGFENESLQDQCFAYIDLSVRNGNRAAMEQCRKQADICSAEEQSQIEVKLGQTLIRQLDATGRITDQFLRRTLILDNGEMSLQSVAVDIQSDDNNSPRSGKTNRVKSYHDTSDFLEIRDYFEDDSDDEEEEAGKFPKTLAEWAYLTVFYGNLYLPWICITLLVFGVFVEIYDMSAENDEFDYNKDSKDAFEKIGYTVVYHHPADADVSGQQKKDDEKWGQFQSVPLKAVGSDNAEIPKAAKP